MGAYHSQAGELGGDLGVQRLDLSVQAGQQGGQGAGHLGAGGSLLAGGLHGADVSRW